MDRTLKATATIVLNDMHAPFQDEAALDVMFQICKHLPVSEVIINGDMMDMYASSNFSKAPKNLEAASLSKELEAGKKLVHQLEIAFPGARFTYLEGNHEFRMQRYLQDNAPQFLESGQLTIPKLLELGPRWTYYSRHGDSWFDTYVMRGDILVGHFKKVSIHPGYTAKALLTQYGMSLIQGHTHRTGKTTRVVMTTHGPKTLTGYENGCLCSLSPIYTPGKDWTHAFSIIWSTSNDKRAIEQIQITNGTAFFQGKLYRANKGAPVS